MDKYTCPKCGYEWLPRTENPVECPNCKKRLWKYRAGLDTMEKQTEKEENRNS